VNHEIADLSPKHTLYAYIRSHAILESFYPLDKLFYTMREDLHGELEQLYNLVRDVFAPNSKRPMWSLRKFFRKFRHRQQWLQAVKKGEITSDDRTARMVADWMAWEQPNAGRPEPQGLKPYLPQFLQDEAKREAVVDFIREQVALTQSLFNFRDSFQGPTAVVHDPRRLLSSEVINSYNLFHLLTYYHIALFEDRRHFIREAGESDLDGDFYVQIRDPRETPLHPSLVYDTDLTPDEFEEKRCRAPVALRHLRITADEPITGRHQPGSGRPVHHGPDPARGGFARGVWQAEEYQPVQPAPKRHLSQLRPHRSMPRLPRHGCLPRPRRTAGLLLDERAPQRGVHHHLIWVRAKEPQMNRKAQIRGGANPRLSADPWLSGPVAGPGRATDEQKNADQRPCQSVPF